MVILSCAGVLKGENQGDHGFGENQRQTTVFTGETHDYLLPSVLRVLDGLAIAGGT